MINARYVDSNNTIVAWETPDGHRASSMASARDVLDYLAAGGQIAPYAPSPEEVWSGFAAKIQSRLDAFALTRGYDSGALCASYKGDPDPKWDGEATCYIAKRSQTWKKFYSIQDAVSAGTREMPTLDDLLLELPVLTWDANG